MAAVADNSFPCSIELQIPFPTNRLASIALQSIQVDPELSPLVQRHLSLTSSPTDAGADGGQQVLRVDYRAATNRMLRVAVNSFMDSLKLVVEVMEHLDADVLAQQQQQQQPPPPPPTE
ncbi:hypothetical protein ACQRIU_003228 [Beauveria bassiana]